MVYRPLVWIPRPIEKHCLGELGESLPHAWPNRYGWLGKRLWPAIAKWAAE